MDRIELKAPAKINLFLQVLGKRHDGYHDIVSLIQAVSHYDNITLERSDGFELECHDLEHVPPENNLAFQAARLVASMAYFPGVRIVLEKHIPEAAGLGGGSSDAAFVIRGLIQLYRLHLDKAELVRQATALGADIPFFLGSGQALVTGIGEVLRDFRMPLNYGVVIVKPPFSLSTAEIYGKLDLSRGGKNPLTATPYIVSLNKRITNAEFVRRTEEFVNDFEEVVFPRFPELLRLRQALIQEGAFHAGMSGTGPAIYGMFAPGFDLEEVVAKMEGRGRMAFPCRPILMPPVL